MKMAISKIFRNVSSKLLQEVLNNAVIAQKLNEKLGESKPSK